jgi:hypothetical protein
MSTTLFKQEIKRTYRPPEIAKLYGVSVQKILAWIRNQELRAVDISQRRGAKPRWVVYAEDLAEFERRRSSTPNVATPAPSRSRTRRHDTYDRFDYG